jgi:ligand-binding SRPBCC domain-containing protein
MKPYQITFKQNFPVPISTLWDFFSSPLNLVEITPNDLTFKITSEVTPSMEMYPGMIITYKISPFGGIKFNWITEITQIAHEKYFIDEQRFGPYQFWHHQHHFKIIDGGVEMTDVLTYGLPLGWLGKIANHLFVAKKLKNIFEYRRMKTAQLFGIYDIGTKSSNISL